MFFIFITQSGEGGEDIKVKIPVVKFLNHSPARLENTKIILYGDIPYFFDLTIENPHQKVQEFS